MSDFYEDVISGNPVVQPTQRDLGSLALIWSNGGGAGTTPTTASAKGYQLGGYLILKFFVQQSNNGGSGEYVLQLPSGYNMAASLLGFSGGNSGHLGNGSFFDGTNHVPFNAFPYGAISNQIYFATPTTNILSSAMNASNRYMQGTLIIPITELILTSVTAYGAGKARSAKPGIVGGSNGVAVPANEIGETFIDASTTFFTTSAANIISRTLQPGIWKVSAFTQINTGAGPVGAKISISTTSATHDTTNEAWNPCTGGFCSASTETYLYLTVATPVHLVGQAYTAAINNAQRTRLLCQLIA